LYFIKKIKKEDIEEMRKDYYTNLTAPMDDMWEEGIIPNGDFFTVNQDEFIAGYFVLDSEGVMIAFYVKKEEEAGEIFKTIVAEKKIQKAYASTYDPLFYGQCVNLKKDISDNTFIYRLKGEVAIDLPFDNIDVVKGTMDDFEKILNHYIAGTGGPEEWLRGYLTKWIDNNGVIVFKLGNKIIGTGEIRPSISSNGYANIGMIVAKEFRRKGLATYIINVLTRMSKEKGYKSISSTTIDNIGSQKTFEKNGYECYHKIYTISF
jgi:predicted acetyltransferase